MVTQTPGFASLYRQVVEYIATREEASSAILETLIQPAIFSGLQALDSQSLSATLKALFEALRHCGRLMTDQTRLGLIANTAEFLTFADPICAAASLDLFEYYFVPAVQDLTELPRCSEHFVALAALRLTQALLDQTIPTSLLASAKRALVKSHGLSHILSERTSCLLRGAAVAVAVPRHEGVVCAEIEPPVKTDALLKTAVWPLYMTGLLSVTYVSQLLRIYGDGIVDRLQDFTIHTTAVFCSLNMRLMRAALHLERDLQSRLRKGIIQRLYLWSSQPSANLNLEDQVKRKDATIMAHPPALLPCLSLAEALAEGVSSECVDSLRALASLARHRGIAQVRSEYSSLCRVLISQYTG